jgi:hypothetical protein
VSRPETGEFGRIRAAVETARDHFVDDPVALGATVTDPIPVQSPAGELDSWFIGLTVEERLVGFFQLEPDLRVHRYSSFERQRSSIDDCPPAAAWLDPTEIGVRARTAARSGEELGEPILSYDGARDRLAWRIPILGSAAVVYVAGNHAYRRD